MIGTDPQTLSTRTRANFIAGAGLVIILLSAGSALLPLLDRLSGSRVVGALLFVAGAVEIFAASLRKESRVPAMVAGGVTMLAGLLFLVNPVARFVPTVTIVTAWLLLRSIVLFVASRLTDGSVKLWISIAAATDFILGCVLLAGISIGTLVVTLFGPTPTLVASFAWVLALSFVVTGLLLLEIASCEREAAES